MKNRIADELLAAAPQGSGIPAAGSDLLHTAQDQLGQLVKRVEAYIQDHPGVGVGAALCIGVVIGWINKRR